MALVTVNVRSDGLGLDEAALVAALTTLPPGAPVVVMIHGHRFMPGQPGHCPHEHILSLRPRPDAPRAVSWPQELGLGGTDAGLAIAFGWPARGSVRNSYVRAARAGALLAALVTRLRALAPDRQVDVIAHSLGARVVLQALALLSPGDLGRIILLSPAEFRGPATTALQTPAGRAAEVLGVTSRANRVFDLLLELLAGGGLQRSLSWGLCQPCPNWTLLRLDDPVATATLSGLGFPIGAPTGPICHWAPYLRAGTFALYRAILARRIAPATLRSMRPTPRQRLRLPSLRLPGSLRQA